MHGKLQDVSCIFARPGARGRAASINIAAKKSQRSRACRREMKVKSGKKNKKKVKNWFIIMLQIRVPCRLVRGTPVSGAEGYMEHKVRDILQLVQGQTMNHYAIYIMHLINHGAISRISPAAMMRTDPDHAGFWVPSVQLMQSMVNLLFCHLIFRRKADKEKHATVLYYCHLFGVERDGGCRSTHWALRREKCTV